jgi:prolyl-tRNA editing enzyme YbaK/EbsC (Cys-tRNA(Pro) deacylase)
LSGIFNFYFPQFCKNAMSLQSVKDFFSARHIDIEIIELPVSTATVALAAVAHGVEPGQIAKTLAFKLHDGRMVLVVAKGDARIDNKKFKDSFGKGKMLGLDEVAVITGHPVGGVCPFGLASPLPVYLDVSLKIYKEVIPAAGSVNSAVRISPEKMADITQAEWVDVCQSQ